MKSNTTNAQRLERLRNRSISSIKHSDMADCDSSRGPRSIQCVSGETTVGSFHRDQTEMRSEYEKLVMTKQVQLKLF